MQVDLLTEYLDTTYGKERAALPYELVERRGEHRFRLSYRTTLGGTTILGHFSDLQTPGTYKFTAGKWSLTEETTLVISACFKALRQKEVSNGR